MKTGTPKSRNRPAPPVVAPSEEVKLERKKIEIGEIFEVDGYCYMFRNPTTASEKPNTDHGHILHEISFLE